MRPFVLALFVAASAHALVHDPAVSRTHIAFIHGSQLWVVPRAGGVARPFTPTAGQKFTPRFSPDGSRLAFGSAETRGMVNLYVAAVGGGSPARVTYIPSHQFLTQWTRDDRLLFHTNSLSFSRFEMQLFTVSPRGGLPERLPLAFGSEGAIDDSGEWLAYTPQWSTLLTRNWKRYRGGAAQDIHLLNLRTHQSLRVTDWKGSDAHPMWSGSTLYYLSDAGAEERMNLWSYDMRTKSCRQLTHYHDLDVRDASIGAGAIVFAYGAELHLYDLASDNDRVVRVSLPAAALERDVDAGRVITSRQLAGGDAFFEARGDLWLGGRNLTATSGVFEREAAISPDGKRVAYFSDASGEYELYVRSVLSMDAAAGAPLTHVGPGFRYRPVWSPDGARLAFNDHTGAIFVADVAARRVEPIDRDAWGETPELAWSADSRWLAYTLTGKNRLTAIWKYDVESKARRQLTSERYNSGTPAFSREHLFFISYRNFSLPVSEWMTGRVAHRGTAAIMAVPLRGTDDDAFERRAFRLGTTAGSITSLSVTSNGDPIFGLVDGAGGRSVRLYDMRQKAERTVIEGNTDFTLSSDGEHLMTVRGGKHLLRTVAAKDETPVDTPMTAHVDLRAEWRQLFTDAWRFYRDFFYAPKVPLRDWDGVRKRYGALIEACVTREEVNLVLADMIGESSVGHAYVDNDGDITLASVTTPTGMLGADYALDGGAYRITRIYEGAATDDLARSPLRGVKEGEYLLAVDGKPLDPALDPRAAFVGIAGREVTITVGPHPAIDGEARKVAVTPLSSEIDLRYRAWVERNRQHVEQASSGRIGYLHLATFTTIGYSEFVRQFHGQTDKEALIIDARGSDGGSIGGLLVDLLNRPQLNSAASRFSGDNAWPVPRWGALFGRKALLVNHLTVSAGENFAYYFRKLKLGPIVGARTWGGLTGLNGNPALIDGGFVAVPNAPFFDETGWLIEGEGLLPDVAVARDPAASEDAQLEAALAQLMAAR